MENKEQNFWLIRDASNVVRGPFKHQEVLNLLKKQQLKNKTEISRANSYWFAVEEKPELARFFPELGLAPPPAEEGNTQMTATLTQAGSSDDRDDITQFVSTATPPAGEKTEVNTQWLSEEMAEEFGELEDFSAADDLIPEKPRNPAPEKSVEDMLQRATVKADTLPSELKDFRGSRPKPINNLIRNPERATGSSSSVVQVPVERSEGPANILSVEAEEAAKARQRKHLFGTVVILAVIGIGFAGINWLSKKSNVKEVSAVTTVRRGGNLSAEDFLRRSLVLYDLEGVKQALAELEQVPEQKGKPLLSLAHAMVKKEFLFDLEGALGQLQAARSFAGEVDARPKNEIENLIAVYNFERDPERSTESLRPLAQGAGAEKIFRYNYALALLRSGKTPEALETLNALVAILDETDALYADATFALGWAQELDPRTRTLAEASFLRATGAPNPSVKARLGLAVHRLRQSGFRAAEADFRAFVEAAPDLDPPTRVPNFRKMQDFDFYNSARSWIRELNLDGPMGSKPAPLVMAVDAILSCLQNRTGEAGKILEGALSASNGDVTVLKALGYHRWKEGRTAEIVELFRDVPKEKMGFAVPYMMGKALVKLDRKSQALKMFELLTLSLPMRAEGWALAGDLLAQEGKRKEAAEKLLGAIRKDPFDLVALRALDRLGQSDVFSEDVMENLPF